ncbi:hypothetical protein FRC06_008574, partial [Ceratobasidium sp. 370]
PEEWSDSPVYPLRQIDEDYDEDDGEGEEEDEPLTPGEMEAVGALLLLGGDEQPLLPHLDYPEGEEAFIEDHLSL